jgi:hypothetical protein
MYALQLLRSCLLLSGIDHLVWYLHISELVKANLLLLNPNLVVLTYVLLVAL